VILSGCVVQPPPFRATASASWWNWSRARGVQVTAYAREGQPPPALHYGQRVEFEARVRRPRNFGNPGAFDYARYLARRKIYWTASVSTGTPVTVLPGTCGSRFQAAIMGLRVMATRTARAALPAASHTRPA
jgi:competence protein ComEC